MDAVNSRHVGHNLLARIGPALAIAAGKSDSRARLDRVLFVEVFPSAEVSRQTLLHTIKVIVSDSEVVAFDVEVPAELGRLDEGVGGRATARSWCGSQPA